MTHIKLLSNPLTTDLSGVFSPFLIKSMVDISHINVKRNNKKLIFVLIFFISLLILKKVF